MPRSFRQRCIAIVRTRYFWTLLIVLVAARMYWRLQSYGYRVYGKEGIFPPGAGWLALRAILFAVPATLAFCWWMGVGSGTPASESRR